MKLIAIAIIIFDLKLFNSRMNQNMINGFSFFPVNSQSLFDGLLRLDKIRAKIPQTSFGLKTHKFRSDNSGRSHEKEVNTASNLPFLTVVDDSVVGMY